MARDQGPGGGVSVTVIAAVSENGFIGRAGALPWVLRDDLRWFMRRTTGASVVMGRRTFETLEAPLPGRQNIVLTRQPAWSAPGTARAATIEEAIAVASADEVFIAGGEAVYAAGLPHADRMDLTRVRAVVEGDARFPEPAWDQWERESVETFEADDRNEHAFTIEVWRRR